jgi:hypothetical protein
MAWVQQPLLMDLSVFPWIPLGMFMLRIFLIAVSERFSPLALFRRSQEAVLLAA